MEEEILVNIKPNALSVQISILRTRLGNPDPAIHEATQKTTILVVIFLLYQS